MEEIIPSFHFKAKSNARRTTLHLNKASTVNGKKDKSVKGPPSYYCQAHDSLNISMLIIILKRAVVKEDNQENCPSHSPVEHIFTVKGLSPIKSALTVNEEDDSSVEDSSLTVKIITS